jgi:hypothetical protein
VFSWLPPAGLELRRAAVDVEAMDCPATAFSTRFGLEREVFLQRWTAAEALAKVLDRPILHVLKRHGLGNAAGSRWAYQPDSGVWLRRIHHDTHWVTVAAII